MRIFSRSAMLVAVLAIAVGMAAPAFAKTDNTFSGIVRHVSVENIKVYDSKSGQTLSFLIFPKFDQIFSDDGKTTYQMKDIHAGQYVKVYYDQHALGARHANRILLMKSNNVIKRKE
jgi:hypothetical protein